MEEIGIFLVCAVIGFAAARTSVTLRNKLHGSFDEVLPSVVILGAGILYLGYGLARPIDHLALWVEKHATFLHLEVHEKGFVSLLSWRDIDAMFGGLFLAAVVGRAIDRVAVFDFVRKRKNLHYVHFVTRYKIVRSMYIDTVLASIIEEEGDDFHKLLLQADREKKRILVTLQNHRLYYGIAVFKHRHPKLLGSHLAYRQLRLVPLLSGYRDNTERKVCLTDMHPPFMDSTSKKASSRSVVEIPYSHIISLQFVDVRFLLNAAQKTPAFMQLLQEQKTFDQK